jgi:uncharacterized protein
MSQLQQRTLAALLIALVASFAAFVASASTDDTERYSNVFLARYPDPPSRLVDDAALLAEMDRRAIKSKLERFECRLGAQMAVVLINSTGRQFIEEFSLAVAARWRLGRATYNDGILLVIAEDDRRLRIEVGTGIEKILAETWLQESVIRPMTDRLRTGDRRAAVEIAIDRVASRLPVSSSGAQCSGAK